MKNKFIENKDLIIQIFRSFDFIEEAWLFGSYAYGQPTKESDLDLCVVVKNGMNTGENFEKVNFKLFSSFVNIGVCHDLIMLDQTTKKEEKDNVHYVYYPIFHYGKQLF